MTILVREFKDSDVEEVNEWARGWKCPPYDKEYFPKTGLIIPDVAVLFLYSTDSNLCLIENLMTNKKYNKPDRSDAIDLLVSSMANLAREKGFKHIFSFPDNKFVTKRFKEKHDYIETKYKLFYRST